jgi:hypothetical protein
VSVRTRTPWIAATIVMTIVAAIAVVITLERSPGFSLRSSGCKASAVSLRGGPVLGAGGTDGDEFQLRYSGSGYCSLSGYPIWSFFNSSGHQLTNGTSTFPASDLFGGSGTSIATELVHLDNTSPASMGFEYFYAEGTKSQDKNPPSCMVSYGSFTLPFADGSAVITVTNVPLAALKLNFCLIKSNLTVTPLEASPWPHQIEASRPSAPYKLEIRKS